MSHHHQHLSLKWLRDVLEVINFIDGPENPEAIQAMKERIAEYARRRQLLSYSELVSGILFIKPKYFGKEPHLINTYSWTGDERHMIGTALAQIVMETVGESNCIITTIVTHKNPNEFGTLPSEVFWKWIQSLGVIDTINEQEVMMFWGQQIEATFRYYRNH